MQVSPPAHECHVDEFNEDQNTTSYLAHTQTSVTSESAFREIGMLLRRWPQDLQSPPKIPKKVSEYQTEIPTMSRNFQQHELHLLSQWFRLIANPWLHFSPYETNTHTNIYNSYANMRTQRPSYE